MRARPQIDAEAARRTRALTLRFHRRFEACAVDGVAALARDIGREIRRESVGVVEPEHRLAIEHLALQAIDRCGKQTHARGEGFSEALFFLQQHTRGLRSALAQFRIGLAHLLFEHRDELMEERTIDAELVSVTNRTTDDAPQHIAPPFVRGQHAIDDEEGASADVIRDHAQ